MAVFGVFYSGKTKGTRLQKELVNTWSRRGGRKLIQVEFWAATASESISAGWRQERRKNSCRRHSGIFANNAKKQSFLG